MGYWTKCKGCCSQIYMAIVTPRGETLSRPLPFDDENLAVCHLDHCSGIPPTYYFFKCCYCHRKYKTDRAGIYRCQNPRCKEQFRISIDSGEATVHRHSF